MNAELLRCTCKNDFQDKTYGAGVRVHNPLKTVNGKPQEYRCTVCLKVRTANKT
jgi:hypothetical protein